MADQHALQLQRRGARCGYCERFLEPVAGGCWECPKCAPLLRQVRDVDEYKAFCAKAAKEKRR